MPARYTRFWILLYNWNSLMCILDKIVCVHNSLETAYIYVFLMKVRRLYVGSCVHIWAQYCEGVTVLLCFTEKQLDCPVNLAVRVWTTSALPRPWWLIKRSFFHRISMAVIACDRNGFPVTPWLYEEALRTLSMFFFSHRSMCHTPPFVPMGGLLRHSMDLINLDGPL